MRRCVFVTDDPRPWRCPTQVQGGRVGMLAHLQVVHLPDLAFDRLADIYDLGPALPADLPLGAE